MYVGLASLTDATIARLHADPPQVWQIVAPDDPDAVVRARGTPSRPGLFARLFGRGPAEAPTPAAGVVERGHGLLVTIT